ncbi:unnamed protein product [Heterobilharzia americana]|nr:unnamed protein product [Heterobilharzia americana]CAH8478487.1 unnamed protein product [Heterobilharzia americana]
MEKMSPLVGLWEKLRVKLDRVTSNQRSASENHETHTDRNVATEAVIPIVNDVTSSLVTVNVYDMLWLNYYVSLLGIGVYHTGVVVHGTEYSYGGHPLTNSGIFTMLPKDSAYLGVNYSFKLTLTMGYTDFTASDVTLLLDSMAPDYSGDQYHLLHKNCNHFSDAFVQILCGHSLPKWINRLATLGSKLPFIQRSLPVEWLTPYKQFANRVDIEHENESQLIEQMAASNSRDTPHRFRRWSAIERLRNCIPSFHGKHFTTSTQNNPKLVTDANYDTCSLFDVPLGRTTHEDDNWYSDIFKQSATLSEPNFHRFQIQDLKSYSTKRHAYVVCHTIDSSINNATNLGDDCIGEELLLSTDSQQYIMEQNDPNKVKFSIQKC